MKQNKSRHNDQQSSNTKRNIGLATLLGVLIIVGVWYFSAPGEPLTTPEEKAEAAPKKEIISKTVKSPIATSDKEAEEEVQEEDPFQGREMKAQFLQVADLYRLNSRYPVGSIPVVGERFAKPVEPFEQAEVDTPYPRDKDDLDPIRIIASVEKMEYFVGEPINARVMLKGGGIDEYSRINVFGSIMSVSQGRDIGLGVNFEQVSFNEYRSAINTQAIAPGQMPREALLNVRVKLEDGRTLVQTVPFFYNGSPSARVENVVNSRQEGAFLLIPLQYNVFQEGYYFVDAILDDAATGQPLVQLQTEGRMQFGNGLLTLKAHIHALMDAGSAGPYRLRIVNTFRAGTFNETRDVAATVSRPFGYDVQGAPFDQYDDIPYDDPEVNERIEFLEQLGSDKENEKS
jgi:hypothetical protein